MWIKTQETEGFQGGAQEKGGQGGGGNCGKGNMKSGINKKNFAKPIRDFLVKMVF